MKLAKATLVGLFLPALSALAAGQALAQQLPPLKPGAIKGETVTLANARNYPFCEVYVGFGISPSSKLQCYNTIGTTGPDGECPAEAFAALDPKKLAADLGARIVVLNPHDQTARRWWIMDTVHAYAAGETYNFQGVEAKWVAESSLRDMEEANKASKIPYSAITNNQLSIWGFNKGSQVFLLRAPEGKVYVMQSVTSIVDKDLRYEQLPQLGGKLKKLPPGWTYEVKTLTQDLEFDTRNASPVGLKHLVLDEYANVYLGCGFDQACNYTP